MIQAANPNSVLIYEIVGVVFVILLGCALHFTYAWSRRHPLVGIFSAVNESVWEHLKMAFWPSLLYMTSEYVLLNNWGTNFFFSKITGILTMIIFIPTVFYSYTALTKRCILAIDICTFIVAVIVGQLVSFLLLTYGELPQIFDVFGIVTVILLATAFAIFTFRPPHFPIFKDSVTGNYGIT